MIEATAQFVPRPFTVPEVASLHIYPIKSCRGIALAEAALDLFGLVGDRRYLIVDEHGQFITQRTLPRLALINAQAVEGRLRVAASNADAMTLPLAPESDALSFDVSIWNDTVRAVDMGATAAQWLTRCLERPARLVAMSGDFARPINKPTAIVGDQAAFADAFPILIISEASLADLNDRLDEPLPMDRFRPNIVVRDCPAFAEDTWKRIRIGDVILRAGGPCARCVLTTTDQQTLERGKEPLRTLAQFRRAATGEVNFGQNFIHETKAGVLRVGTTVEVVE